MKNLTKLLSVISVSIAATIAILGTVIIKDDRALLFESEESKTPWMEPVYNQIRWFSFKDKDIWMMNQSHHGLQAGKAEWDRLAIVVDKTKTPKTAQFYQLEPGELNWNENLKQVPYKVSCFMCHSNGPRAIRPNFDSTLGSLSLKDRLKTWVWNMRIKSYGRITLGNPSLRWTGKYENEELKIPLCIKCHKESGLFARGPLVRQQISTIKFMLERGHMPPLGFFLSKKEKLDLEEFIRGF